MTENVDLNEKILYKKDVFGFFMGNALAMLIAL